MTRTFSSQSERRTRERAVRAVLRQWDELTPAGAGPIRELEARFAGWLGTPYVLAMSSATAAIEVALRAAGIGPGDEVILSAYDWGAAAGAVLRVGAQPVFADVELRTGILDPSSVNKRLTARTTGLVVTHLFGCPAPMDELLRIAERHALFVLEDCAQALGARYRDRSVGTFGHAAAFSFGWGKLLSAGEGGILVLHDAELFRRAVGLSQHPLRQMRDTGTMEPWGDLAMNARMHPVAAAMVLAQWEALPHRLERRRRICRQLSWMLRRIPQLVPPDDPPLGVHAFHRYSPVIIAEDADAGAIAQALAACGFPVHRGYIPVPLHLRSMFRTAYREGDCPQAERRCRSALGIDLDGKHLSREWLKSLTEAFQEVFNERRP